MTRYSDFVRRYMRKSGKNWSCSVCDIQKGDLYKKFKNDEDTSILSERMMMSGEDRDAPAPAPVKKKRRLRIVGQKRVETLEPSPIPPPMALEPANPNTRTAMPLGSMTETIQVEEDDLSAAKALLVFAYGSLHGNVKGPPPGAISRNNYNREIKEIISSISRKFGIDPYTRKEADEDAVLVVQGGNDYMETFLGKFNIETELHDFNPGEEVEDDFGDIITKKYDREYRKFFNYWKKNWVFRNKSGKNNLEVLKEMVKEFP